MQRGRFRGRKKPALWLGVGLKKFSETLVFGGGAFGQDLGGGDGEAKVVGAFEDEVDEGVVLEAAADVELGVDFIDGLFCCLPGLSRPTAELFDCLQGLLAARSGCPQVLAEIIKTKAC